MTETVVHVTTLWQWQSVLDVWFKQGYDWGLFNTHNDYREEFYHDGSRQLGLNMNDYARISYWSLNNYPGDNLIEYSDFMSQQKDDNQTEMVSDPVYKPSHYQLEDGTQVKDHITSLTAHMSGVRAWATGNAIKYLARAGRKDDMVKDLKKAQENIQIIIDDIEKWGCDK